MLAAPHWPPPGHFWRDAIAYERALIQHGQYSEALEFGELMYDAATRDGAPDGVLAMCWAHRGDLLRSIEDFQSAADAYAECLRRLTPLTEQANCAQMLIFPLQTLAAIQLRLSHIDDAVTLLDQADRALDHAEPLLDRRLIQLHTTLLRAWAAVVAGDATTARELYLQTHQTAATLQLTPSHRLLQVIDDGIRWIEDPAATPPDLFLWDEPDVRQPTLLERYA
jgi:tetratricopeptide (TPR) repeat protein